MKKLKLELDQVQVISFSPDSMERERGTVNGASDTGTDQSTIFACSESAGGSCDSCFPNYCPREPASARNPC